MPTFSRSLEQSLQRALALANERRDREEHERRQDIQNPCRDPISVPLTAAHDRRPISITTQGTARYSEVTRGRHRTLRKACRSRARSVPRPGAG
jgi:hypothetical protein